MMFSRLLKKIILCLNRCLTGPSWKKCLMQLWGKMLKNHLLKLKQFTRGTAPRHMSPRMFGTAYGKVQMSKSRLRSIMQSTWEDGQEGAQL